MVVTLPVDVLVDDDATCGGVSVGRPLVGVGVDAWTVALSFAANLARTKSVVGDSGVTGADTRGVRVRVSDAAYRDDCEAGWVRGVLCVGLVALRGDVVTRRCKDGDGVKSARAETTAIGGAWR